MALFLFDSRFRFQRRNPMLRARAGTFLLAAAVAAGTAEAGQADLILIGAKVVTGDSKRPAAEAVAIEGERIRTVLPQVMSGFISHGITTVRSTGDPLPYIAELRDRMEQAMTGPRVVMTGAIPSSPDGHPATTVCGGNQFCRRTVALEVATEEQARQAVRELART
jgi:hypothetical protein